MSGGTVATPGDTSGSGLGGTTGTSGRVEPDGTRDPIASGKAEGTAV